MCAGKIFSNIPSYKIFFERVSYSPFSPQTYLNIVILLLTPPIAAVRHLSHCGIMVVHLHAQFCAEDWSQDFAHSRQILFQRTCISSPLVWVFSLDMSVLPFDLVLKDDQFSPLNRKGQLVLWEVVERVNTCLAYTMF